MKYKRTEANVSAIKWNGAISFEDVYDFIDADNNPGVIGYNNDIGQIRTSNGIANINVGDFVVKDSNGIIYICDNKHFQDNYINLL